MSWPILRLRPVMGAAERGRVFASWLVSALFMVAAGHSTAMALPSFADQTGMACSACHVGALGPQLTAYGREFKLGGYTDNNGSSSVPVSAMAIASYISTGMAQDEAPAPGYGRNGILALDEANLFLAGGFGEHFGTFAQVTYDGIGHKWAWDNVDLRTAWRFDFEGADTIVGVSVNNSPTVQDVWNTTPVWGFPYTDSGLAPSPSAAPLISDALAQNVLGATVYGWWNDSLYVEAGAYGSLSSNLLKDLGVDPAETSQIKGAAPYFRVAYQTTWGSSLASIGAFGLFADLYPGRDRSTGTTDSYRDLGLDASYQYVGTDNDIFSVNTRLIGEHQKLSATQILGGAEANAVDLYDFRINASYYFGQSYGATIGMFDTWGDGDPLLYADNRTEKPNSKGVTLQIDATPFGQDDSFAAPYLNVRVGAQYTLYTQFNGAARNYDGTGRNAADNNTLRLFLWSVF